MRLKLDLKRLRAKNIFVSTKQMSVLCEDVSFSPKDQFLLRRCKGYRHTYFDSNLQIYDLDLVLSLCQHKNCFHAC